MRPVFALVLALACLAAPAARAQTAAQAAANEGPRFDILEYVVEGDTLLGSDAIERAVYPFLGPGRTVADAEGARKALQKAYEDAGYLSVSVALPQQKVDAGEVRLQVVQAPVASLRVTGAGYHLPSQIRAAVPALAPGSVPDFNAMQDQLAKLALTTGDTEVTPLLAAGDQPGTMAVELKVQDSAPLHGSVELNSKQSANTAGGRIEAALSYGNLFQAGHEIGFTWFYSPRRPDQSNVQTFDYSLPLGAPGDRLSLFATHSDSNTPTPLGGGTVSRGNTSRLRWSHGLPGRTGIDQSLMLGFNYKDLANENQDIVGATTASPPLLYSTFQLSYNLNLQGDKQGRQTRFQADFVFGLAGLNRRFVDCSGTVLEQFDCNRVTTTALDPTTKQRIPGDSRPGFQILDLSLAHQEPIGRWTLSAKLQAQLTDQPLVPAEQVVYGGVDSVRGYYEGEQAGDYGAAWRFELLPPPWTLSPRASVQALVFWDQALLHRFDALPGERSSIQLASAGFGLRLQTNSGLQAALGWARVVDATTTYNAGNGLELPTTGSGGARWSFSLSQQF